MMCFFYSVLHMFVDGVCAYAMFGTYVLQENGNFYLLLYNFCAFALQMPIGALFDIFAVKMKQAGWDIPFAAVAAGVLLTLAGAVTHPAVLGIGNALFHVGGGLGTIREDMLSGWHGRRLGVFVAPGALGLFAGTWMAKYRLGTGVIAMAGSVMFCLCGALFCVKKHVVLRPVKQFAYQRQKSSASGSGRFCLAVCCFIVVILRSYIGLAVAFPWKTTALYGGAAVLAVTAGKVAGGFFAARYGCPKTALLSLAFAAACYWYSPICAVGLMALFLFNMTMPMTLYLLVGAFHPMGGFAFGLLTFALFLGYLPVYFGWNLCIGGTAIGCAGSILSLLLLRFGMRKGGRNGFYFPN